MAHRGRRIQEKLTFYTKRLQVHNQKNAKAGDKVVLSENLQSSLNSMFGVVADSAVLTRKECGAWWAEINGKEWCIGGGFDWMIA